MFKNVFSSYITISFRQDIYTSFYNNHYKSTISLSTYILLPIYSLLSIIMLTLIIIQDIKSSSKCQINECFKYFYPIYGLLIFIDVWNPFLYIIFFRHYSRIQRNYPIVTYFLFSVHYTWFAVVLEVLFQINANKFSFWTILEYMFKMLFHFSGVIEFFPSFILNIIVPGWTLWWYFGLKKIQFIIIDNGISMIVLNISVILMSYIITIINKKNTYFNCNWVQSHRHNEKIWNRLNVGYMRVKENKIKNLNKSWYETVVNTEKIKGKSNENNKGNVREFGCEYKDFLKNKERIFEIWFSDYKLNAMENDGNNNHQSKSQLVTESIIINNENTNAVMNKNKVPRNSDFILTNIANRLNYKPESKEFRENIDTNFTFLNYQTWLTESNKKIIYEVYCNFNSKTNEFEFIFNDVTHTKEYEEKSFDYKIQNIFLTKIAHEFKNPLVCITELNNEWLDLTHEIEEKSKKKKWLKIGNLIQSYNEYLFLWIKDLDFFTDKSKYDIRRTEKDNDYSVINLQSLLSFCQDITKVKLNLADKTQNVSFITKLDEGVPEEIVSDCKKIKQIWLNWISHSIKNTKSGTILLNIRKPQMKSPKEYIEFYIEDTGIDVSDELFKQLLFLFHPEQTRSNSVFEYDFKRNSIPGLDKGFGLWIVKQIMQTLRIVPKFESKDNQGMKIWFDVPIKPMPASNTINTRRKAEDEFESKIVNNMNETVTTISISLNNFKLKVPNKMPITSTLNRVNFNVIIADDEELVRKASIRVLLSTARDYDINITVIDASDGVDVLSKIYQSSFGTFNRRIDAVISDQTMNYLNGAVCKKIWDNNVNEKSEILYFWLTAYDTQASYFKEVELNGIFSKPFRRCDAEEIINALFLKYTNRE